MKRAVSAIAILIVALIVLDLLAGAACRGSGLPDRVVDIHHPTTLIAKLDRLKNAPHPKIVLVGDSLVYGGILEDFGDANWREHGLGPQLSEATDGSPFVMNLGINGALPIDLEALVALVVKCDVDWIVLDVHLRPFSSDFSDPAHQMSRPWLREIHADENGRAHWRPTSGGTSSWIASRFADGSFLVRNRMLVQENLLSTKAARKPLLRPKAPASKTDEEVRTDEEVQSLIRLAQLKARLRQLDLNPDAPQVAALQRMLRDLSMRGQKNVVFYAKENPGLLADVMEPDDHAARYKQLIELVREAQKPTGVFVLPIAELDADHFVDFTHLNAAGYQILARRLAQEIK